MNCKIIYNFLFNKGIVKSFILLGYFLVSSSKCFCEDDIIYRYITKVFDNEIILDDSKIGPAFPQSLDTTYDNDGNTLIWNYYIDKSLSESKKYIFIKKKPGKEIFYYPNEQIEIINNYDSLGRLNGEIQYYFPNGKLKRNDIYFEGKWISGICYDTLGIEIDYFPYEVDPEFNYDLFHQKFKYPKNLLDSGIQERVNIKALLDDKGNVVKIKYDSNNSIEFIRGIVIVIISNKLFNPAYQDGKPVWSWINIPFVFKLR